MHKYSLRSLHHQSRGRKRRVYLYDIAGKAESLNKSEKLKVESEMWNDPVFYVFDFQVKNQKPEDEMEKVK